MNDKPNMIPIQSYASQYASAVCSDFFEDYDFINGEQIVSLANVHQVNLMVVKNIFQTWKSETAKLKSPFFNYEAAEVEEALNHFMNILSKNISIKEADFKLLFEQSTRETLLLLLYPGYFFNQLLSDFGKKINLEEELFPLFKYIRVHTVFINELKEKLANEGSVVKRKKALKVLETLVEKQPEQLEEVQELLQEFDEEIPIHTFRFTASWHVQLSAEEEDDGLEELETIGFGEPSFIAEEDDSLTQEIANEFERPFLEGVLDAKDEEYDEEEIEDEVYIADHLKTSLDPVNDNVFISNQEDILNAAIIEDFEVTPEQEETVEEENRSTLYDPKLLTSDNPFANATNDLNLSDEEDDLPLHFEDSEEESHAVEDTSALFSLEHNSTNAEVEDSISEQFHIDEEDTHTPIPETETTHFETEEKHEVSNEPVFNRDLDTETNTSKEEEEEETLHDLLAKRAAQEEGKQPTLLDKLKANNIKKLEGSIPLHLKFKFQNDLFGGNSEEFNTAIELIDQAPDYHEALALVKSRYVLKYDWDFSHDTTLEFIGLIEEKYD